jgi:hypothetical protein
VLSLKPLADANYGWLTLDRNRPRYQLGIPFPKIFPEFGGSLLVVAKLANPIINQSDGASGLHEPTSH